VIATGVPSLVELITLLVTDWAEEKLVAKPPAEDCNGLVEGLV